MVNATLLVLGPDGSILQAGAGVAPEWQGKRVTDVGLPSAVVDAARELIEEALTTTTWLGRRIVDCASGKFEILVVEAVPLRRTRTDVRDLLTRTTELLLEQARAIEVSVQVSTDPEMPSTLVIDGEKIAWGIATLVGTALRHLSSRNSKKEVNAGFVRVQATYLAASDEISIMVGDNGPGISKERLRAIGEPASAGRRTVAANQDSAHTPALGLLVLKDVMTAHGGRLEVESSTDRANHGTRVTLFIPTH